MIREAQAYPAEDRAAYSSTIKIVHWTMAVLIVINIGIASYMTPFDDSRAEAEALYVIHKSIGLLLFGLVIVRLWAKTTSERVEPLASLRKWEANASHITHLSLYVLLVAVPIFGYVQSSSYAFGGGVSLFGLQIPELVPDDIAIFEFSAKLHRSSAYALLVLVFLHVSAALKHQLFDEPKSKILGRIT